MLILPNGDINWSCPCLGGMATGPCGAPFREAFSCFHFSKEETKGADCYEKFKGMQECMLQYPNVYGSKAGGGEDAEKMAAALENGGDDVDLGEEKTSVEKMAVLENGDDKTSVEKKS